MSAVVWLIITAVLVAVATLATLGLLAHIDEGRSLTVVAFDALVGVSAILGATRTWSRYRD